jgi:hypothetical protein
VSSPAVQTLPSVRDEEHDDSDPLTSVSPSFVRYPNLGAVPTADRIQSDT